MPGDRTLSWKKLRALLGVSRISLPDAHEGRQVTGYERGMVADVTDPGPSATPDRSP
ncbi:MAG: hypothetical protein KGP12_12495 [Actinomycetales bacterium]|nr:hypothetical protein [Actinomycetales bacterium]